jgi:tRNA(Ile2) C34 agmatinyltransferase TiaS
MKARTCTSCGLRSYSAGANPWRCPYCGTNMDEAPDEPIARLVPKVYPEEADNGQADH